MLNRIRNISLLLVVLMLSFPALLGQVVVERSKDKVIISGKQYYIHTVRKGETAYSISRAYNVTVDELISENPNSAGGIREGQSLRLPIRPVSSDTKPPQTVEPARDESRYIYHTVSKGETVYSLSKRFKVSEDDITESNPGVNIRKLSVGTTLAVPKKSLPSAPDKEGKKTDVKEDQPVVNEPVAKETISQQYLTHKVVKGESLTSIAEKYGVSVKEIRKLNRGITFPGVGDELKIPVERISEIVVPEVQVADTVKPVTEPVDDEEKPVDRKITEIEDLKGRMKVAMLLPMYLNENSIRTEIDSSQVIKGKRVMKTINRPEDWIYPGTMPFLELYSGALVAADSLRSLGLDIEINLFDIREDTIGTMRLIESGKLNDMDLIVGPVFNNNLRKVASWAAENDIPVVSPVPLSSTEVLNGNRNLFVVNPSLETAQDAIASYVSALDTCNFIVVRVDSGRFDYRVNRFSDLVMSKLSETSSSENIKFREFRFISRSLLRRDSIGRLEKVLKPGITNMVLIASEDAPVISEIIMDLHTLSRKYRIKIIGLPGMRDMENLDPRFYFDLGIELFSSYRIDFNQKDIKLFTGSYRKKFLVEPSEMSFAWQGYDITWFFLTGLSMHGRKLLSKPWIHNPDLLQTEYIFERTGSGNGFENKKLYLVRYTPEMEIVFPDPEARKISNVNKN